VAQETPECCDFLQEIGVVDGLAINTATLLGQPAHDHELWFPHNSAELQEVTVEQVDVLLFFYTIPNPRDLTKQLGTTPLHCLLHPPAIGEGSI
jgi:hypothetical protein